MRCPECYSEDARITPLLQPLACLKQHTQYICGTCGRCICIEHDEKRGLQRWNFPFKSLEIAKLYLRSAEVSRKKPCGIYEIHSQTGRISYKIFQDEKELEIYLIKNKDKTCEGRKPIFQMQDYCEYPNTQIRMLNKQEIDAYMAEKLQKNKDATQR